MMGDFFIPNGPDGGTDAFEVTRGGDYFVVNKIWKRDGEIAHSGARPFKTEQEANKYVEDLFMRKVKREDKYNLINYTGKAYWTAENNSEGKKQYYVTAHYIIDGYMVEDLYDCIFTYSREEAQKKIDELS